MHPDQRVYNMILTERAFGGGKSNTYALLGFENGESWNLLGGKQDVHDVYNEVAAARELYEESGKLLDKRNDYNYWKNRPYYEYTKHKVFIHEPGSIDINIEKLNKATKLCINDKSLSHDYKEMHRYQLIKLSDLIKLTESKTSIYNHPTETEMKINEWLLFTLKNADKSHLSTFV